MEGGREGGRDEGGAAGESSCLLVLVWSSCVWVRKMRREESRKEFCFVRCFHSVTRR